MLTMSETLYYINLALESHVIQGDRRCSSDSNGARCWQYVLGQILTGVDCLTQEGIAVSW